MLCLLVLIWGTEKMRNAILVFENELIIRSQDIAWAESLALFALQVEICNMRYEQKKFIPFVLLMTFYLIFHSTFTTINNQLDTVMALLYHSNRSEIENLECLWVIYKSWIEWESLRWDGAVLLFNQWPWGTFLRSWYLWIE